MFDPGPGDRLGAIPAFELKDQRKREHFIFQNRGQLANLLDDILVAAHTRIAPRLQLLDQFQNPFTIVRVL